VERGRKLKKVRWTLSTVLMMASSPSTFTVTAAGIIILAKTNRIVSYCLYFSQPLPWRIAQKQHRMAAFDMASMKNSIMVEIDS
jgi:hypothetical protein